MDVRRGCLVSFSVTLPYSNSLIELGARLLDNKVQKSSCVHPLPTVLGLQTHIFTPSFYVASGALNLGSHAFEASILTCLALLPLFTIYLGIELQGHTLTWYFAF